MSEPKLWKGFPHVLRSQQFDVDTLIALFEQAEEIDADPQKFSSSLKGKRFGILFAEASLRTRLSHQFAAEDLGARTFVESQAKIFSTFDIKGESLEDAVEVCGQLGVDGLVIRWDREGAADDASVQAGGRFPIINGGDGSEQHPTQGIGDVFTIWREPGRLLERSKVTVAYVGDMTGRAVRSLVYQLSKFPNVNNVFISPESAMMRRDVIQHLEEHGRPHLETCNPDWNDLAPEVDVWYWTRSQSERRKGVERDRMEREITDDCFVCTPERAATMKPTAIILHPLPRNKELPRAIDVDLRARYFQEVKNCMLGRKALFHTIFQHLG
jgi:aspartate carbamoyltransferase